MHRKVFLHGAHPIFVLMLSLSFIITACNGDDTPSAPPEIEATLKTVRVLFASDGLGDLAYNDAILRGILEKQQEEPFRLEYAVPRDASEAEAVLGQWQAEDDGLHYFTILASGEYEALARKAIPSGATPNYLIFDTPAADLAIPSFHFAGYGASFLAGIAAFTLTEAEEAAYIGGQEDDAFVKECHDGFRDGYRYAGGKEVVAKYLSTTAEGFDDPRKAYQMANELYKFYPFIYIVAGKSNKGVYEYLRDYPDYKYTAGMDADQSAYSTQIIGSVIKDAGGCVNQYITRWLEGETLPVAERYTLQSGFVSFEIAGPYKQKLGKAVAENLETAIEKEKAYENAKH